jgi:hypothetical protein
MYITSGCGFISIESKVDIAYNIGKYSTEAYMNSGKDSLSIATQENVTKLWEAFDKNIQNVTVENVNAFPDMLKNYVAKANLPADKTEAVNNLIDKYWEELNEKADVLGVDSEQLVLILHALNDGINDALTDYENMKEN